MTVDTFNSPLQSIDFPAITLCPSLSLQPDNWALTEQVFNSFEFYCELENDDCDEIRKDFKPLLKLIYDLLFEKINNLEFYPGVLEDLLSYEMGLAIEKTNHLYWAIIADKLDFAMIDSVIIETMGRNYVKVHDFYDMLPKEKNGSMECDDYCTEWKQGIRKRFFAAYLVTDLDNLKLGTILRQFSDQIGFSFQNELIHYQWPPKDTWMTCNEIGQIETLVFEVMKSMATQIGLKSSLLDIPNVFASTELDYPKAQFYPLHSICNAGYYSVLTSNLVSRKLLLNFLGGATKKLDSL